MLNFAEQTGSGAVIVVWSFLIVRKKLEYIKLQNIKTYLLVHEIVVNYRIAHTASIFYDVPYSYVASRDLRYHSSHVHSHSLH